MLSQAEALYALQKIDITLTKNRKRLAEIATLLASNEQVKQAQHALDEAITKLNPLRAKAKDIELELQTTQNKHKTSEDRLYSGLVKNPKELQDLQHEIESLKHRIETLEEQSLEAMILVEDATNIVNEAELALKQAQQQAQQQNKDLMIEQNKLEKEVETLNAQREKALQGITPENLKTYEAMRPKKANQPVAVLRNGSCQLCGIEQTGFIIENVRKGKELVLCLGCGRILVEVL
ncbi:MAG: hypothetical protein CUN52_04775 [Phototrophicales bacterium]|jgi:predicted  nucleic acid-binding Zn-ribbon protein|nr:MAG: hypothetical protein CUN52_04775 [Phototrophicales bacterium]